MPVLDKICEVLPRSREESCMDPLEHDQFLSGRRTAAKQHLQTLPRMGGCMAPDNLLVGIRRGLESAFNHLGGFMHL